MTRYALGFVLILLARPVSAGVCVAVDEQRDTLSPDDRRAALITFGEALAKAGVQVTGGDCATTYTVYNVKLGETISVYADGPDGRREGRATKLDELPRVYQQLATAMVTHESMATGGSSIDRTNVTEEQAAPRRIGSDNVKLLRLGYGALPSRGANGGPSFGIGWRFELDRVAIEISAINLTVAGDTSQGHRSVSFVGDWLRLSSLYYTRPLANETPYLGGGLGWGGSEFYDNTTMTGYTGTGLEATLSAGYEALRSSTIRMFVELDATLPFYTAEGHYVPSITLQLGVGLGKANTLFE